MTKAPRSTCRTRFARCVLSLRCRHRLCCAPRNDMVGRMHARSASMLSWFRAAAGALSGLTFVVANAAVAAPTTAPDAATRAYTAVDPFIGTGGEGHTFPGAV